MNCFYRCTLMAMLMSVLAPALFADDDKKVDPSGTWRWEYEMQGESFNDSMKLNLDDQGKVVGTFIGRDRKAEIEAGTMNGNEFSAAIELDFDGTPVRLQFSGPIKDDQIDGTVTAEYNGETREFPWKPKRSVKLEDVVGSWDLRIEGAGYVFEPKMKISKEDKEFKIVYTSNQGTELDVEGLKVDDQSNLLFTVRSEYDGSPMKVDFKGRPLGNKLSGNIQYDVGGNTGEAPFVGKRKPEQK